MAMNTYDEVIDYLYTQLPMFQNSGPGAYKPGLTTARILAGAFGNPQQKFRTIHVAGTNGKGSVTHTIASVLQAAGLKVGLYTSPHLLDFRERIRINGEMISRAEVMDFVERFMGMNLDCHPSFFELITVMAFDHFVRHEVDIAVIEVGLGGRLDTTNIITPLLSVITNISLDHVALLGDTEVQIAREKAGIIKPGVPVVIGEAEGEVRGVFQEVAAQVKAPIIFAQDSQIAFDGKAYSIEPAGPCVAEFDLKGDYQRPNANTLMAVLRELRRLVPISDADIIAGFATVTSATGLAGRWQTVADAPVRVVCDTGHNIGAWRILGPRLDSEAKNTGTLRMVIGFVNDKDVSHIFDFMPKGAKYYFVTPSVTRGLDASKLLDISKDKGLKDVQVFGSVADGFEVAYADALSGDMIFVGGSTFVVADFMQHTSGRWSIPERHFSKKS